MRQPKLSEALRQVMELLVAGRHDELARLTPETRLSADEIARAVSQYGRTLVVPPPAAYDDLDAVEVRGGGVWSVRMPLWTKEEGQSDLSIEVTVAQRADKLTVTVDDIHVL